MVSFKQKELEQIKTIGEKLKTNRLAKGLTIEEVFHKTHISTNYLLALESGDFDQLPGEIYVQNFLRVYSEFLGLNYKTLLADYQFEKTAHQIMQTNQFKLFNKDKERKAVYWYSFITANLIKNLFIIILVVAGLGFLLVQINRIVSPPLLIISNPDKDITTTDNYLEVIGWTDPGATVLINGQNILIDPSGNFKEGINLQSGLNMIKISSSKKYSKTRDIYREVIVTSQ